MTHTYPTETGQDVPYANMAADEKEPDAYPLEYIEDCSNPGMTRESFSAAYYLVTFRIYGKRAFLDLHLLAATRFERIRFEMGIVSIAHLLTKTHMHIPACEIMKFSH